MDEVEPRFTRYRRLEGIDLVLVVVDSLVREPIRLNSILPFSLDREHGTSMWDLCSFRGVQLDALQAVLSRGIDVFPTDHFFFCDGFDKAVEYGGLPKLVMSIDGRSTDRTFREISAETPEIEIAELSRTFPTRLLSKDGRRFWMSRLPESDPRIAKPYEAHYARWIPGDPRNALRGLIVIARAQDCGELRLAGMEEWADELSALDGESKE